jgi:hypothetical protein
VRDLVPAMEDGQASLALVTYRIRVLTGGLPGAGTNANVKNSFLELCVCVFFFFTPTFIMLVGVYQHLWIVG